MTYSTPADEGQLGEREAAEEICAIGRRLWERQYIEASAGNISYRLSDGRILATPTMMSKGFMQPEDLVMLDAEGNQVGGRRKTTSEILVHLAILKHRPDIRCVIHSHAPHATAFAVTGEALPKCVHPEQELFLGEVPIAPYETPGTQKVADSLLPYIRDYNVFLLASHGVVAAGKGILDAFWKTEIVDSYCRLIILTKSLGEPNQLSAQNMRELLQTKQNLGIPDRRLDSSPASKPDVACDTPPPATSPSSPSIKAALTNNPDLVRRVTEAVIKRLSEAE